MFSYPFPKLGEHFYYYCFKFSVRWIIYLCFIRIFFFSGVLSCSLSETCCSALEFCLTFSLCLHKIRWSSYLFWFWWYILLWECPYAFCMCPVALVGELDLKSSWTTSPLGCDGTYCLGGNLLGLELERYSRGHVQTRTSSKLNGSHCLLGLSQCPRC